MNCLKCGKETEENQVFCNDCRQIMENYPVKPGTAVYLPHRDPAAQERKMARHRELTPEETLSQMRGIIRWLTTTVAILTVLLCLVAGLLIHNLDSQSANRTIGRNYTTSTGGEQTES